MSSPKKVKIGEIIRAEVESRGMKLSHFASMINRTRQNVHNIFNRSTIDTELLFEISKSLNRDFFEVYSDLLKESQVPSTSETSSTYNEDPGGVHLHVHIEGTENFSEEQQIELAERLKSSLDEFSQKQKKKAD